MTLLYYDPCFLEHDTGPHPESAARLERIVAHLAERGLSQRCATPAWEAATDEALALVHDPRHVAATRQYAARGGGRIEVDTVLGRQSFAAASRAAGAAADAVRRVVAGEDTQAICLVRPPGHHALPGAPMGFCLLNNVALAARTAIRRLGLDQVLIVDWDVHHGNGTQEVFWQDNQVGFLSIHRWPFYPGTGDRHETGAGRGLGTTRNLPVRFGTPRRDYLSLFAKEVEAFAARIRPQLLLISAGFDSHRLDPIGSLGLETEDFATLTDMVLDVAQAHCGGRCVSVLEGGYNLEMLPLCAAQHLGRLLERQPPAPGRGVEP